MSTQHLGPQIDIHTGGVDNIFPHHEDERAQSEAYTGARPFARFWLHGQHLLADGLKMAKSTGNAYTLTDLVALSFEPLAFRYLCLTAHYRARLNFTFTSLRAAQTGLHRLRGHVARWGPPGSIRSPEAVSCRERFWALAADDLALPRRLAIVWSLVRGPLGSLPASEKAALARDFDALLGLDLGLPPARVPADPLRGAVSSPGAVPATDGQPDRYRLSVIVAVQPAESLAAVRRCVQSVQRHSEGLGVEVLVVDATGSPAAHAELSSLADPLFFAQKSALAEPSWRAEEPSPTSASSSTDEALRAHSPSSTEWSAGQTDADPRVRILWIDHDPGAAAARNLGLRASRGTFVALLDPSVELVGNPWPDLIAGLDDDTVGAVGTYGLVTGDMRHFHDAPMSSDPVEVDALQNYLIVLRRADLPRIGPLDEHYRFYRILDLDLSYSIRDRIGRLVSLGELPLVRHRHTLWETISEGDREERSRKNFGRFLKRWDHRHDLRRHGAALALAGEAALHG